MHQEKCFEENQKNAQQVKLAAFGFEGILDTLRADTSNKAPQIIFDISGFDSNNELKAQLIAEINVKTGPRENHVEHGTTLCLDPNKLDGSRHFNGGGTMGGLLGFEMGLLMLSAYVPAEN
jgi:hypothetical protein